jgi:hypothetical protein
MGAGVAGAFVGGFWFGRSVVRPALEHDQVFGIGKALEAYDDFMYKTFLGRVYDWFQGDPPGSTNAASRDPNEKVGPAGFGPAGFTTGDDVLSYRVSFENDAAATAPAQRVTITDRLSSQLAWDTLEFKEVAFGDVLLPVPAGSQYFATSMPLTLNDKVFTVEFELGLRSETGEVYATFASIDPHTELPPDVLTGFLPPEDGTGRGQGYFSYVIRAKPNLPTGTEIRNVALITFDDNPPIATNQVDPHDPSKGTDPTKEALNTIDAGIPSSQVTALPATSGPIFIVRWSGSDDTGGSDIAGYDVFVSDNGGAFTRWKSQTTETTAVFDGQVDHTYRFYTVAVDNVGHGEAVPATFDTQTLVLAVSNWQNPDIASDVDGDGEVLPMDVLTLINFINSRGGDTSLPSSPEQPPPYWNVNGDEAITALDVLTVINYINNPPAGQAEGEAPAESTSLAVPPPTLSSSVASLAIWTGGVTVAPPPATEPANSVWRPLTASERARSRAHPWPAGPQGVWATELMDGPPLETEPWDEFASLLEETLADIAEQVADDWSGF